MKGEKRCKNERKRERKRKRRDGEKRGKKVRCGGGEERKSCVSEMGEKKM